MADIIASDRGNFGNLSLYKPPPPAATTRSTWRYIERQCVLIYTRVGSYLRAVMCV